MSRCGNSKDRGGTSCAPYAATLLAVPCFRYLRLLFTRRATGTFFIDSKVLLHFTKTCLAPQRVPTAFWLPPLHRMLLSRHESTVINMGHTHRNTHRNTHRSTHRNTHRDAYALREPQVYAYARHTFACVRACVLLEIVAYTKYSL